jgi:hypothetical protein
LFGLKVSTFLTHQEEIASCHTYGFQASVELEQPAQSDKRRAGEEQPPKDIQSTEVQDNCYAHLAGEEEPYGPVPYAPQN